MLAVGGGVGSLKPQGGPVPILGPTAVPPRCSLPAPMGANSSHCCFLQCLPCSSQICAQFATVTFRRKEPPLHPVCCQGLSKAVCVQNVLGLFERGWRSCRTIWVRAGTA